MAVRVVRAAIRNKARWLGDMRLAEPFADPRVLPRVAIAPTSPTAIGLKVCGGWVGTKVASIDVGKTRMMLPHAEELDQMT